MDKNKKLTTIDFSQKSVNKAVLGDIFQNPVSTYITALAGIFLFANIMIFGIPILLYATLGAALLGVGSFFVNLYPPLTSMPYLSYPVLIIKDGYILIFFSLNACL